MPDHKICSYTLYLPQRAHGAVLHIVQRQHPNCTIEGAEETGRWSTVKFPINSGTVTITSMERKQPMDEFSRIILGSFSRVDRASGSSARLKRRVLKCIADTDLLLGVRAVDCDPVNLLHEILQEQDGCLFNGAQYYDKHGECLRI